MKEPRGVTILLIAVCILLAVLLLLHPSLPGFPSRHRSPSVSLLYASAGSLPQLMNTGQIDAFLIWEPVVSNADLSWLIIKNHQVKNSRFIKNDMILFSLIFGLIGIYVSSAFVRLEVFASLSLIILSSLGLSMLVKEILKNTESKNLKNLIIKFSFIAGIMILLVIPVSFPTNGNWATAAKTPPTILNGGTAYPISTNDWLESMEWIKNNTPKDAVVASWWDYGYWISTLGERASIADNSTLYTSVIEKLAKMLLSSPEELPRRRASANRRSTWASSPALAARSA